MSYPGKQHPAQPRPTTAELKAHRRNIEHFRNVIRHGGKATPPAQPRRPEGAEEEGAPC